MTADQSSSTPSHTMQKRKVAVFFGYVGEHYYGMQFNQTQEHLFPSIEAALMSAFFKAGMISAANYSSEANRVLPKLGWQRTSRTDKGVHALVNLVSLKMLLRAGETYPEAVERINVHLPIDIRVYLLRPVTASFNSYMMCMGRTYEYYLPTFGLMNRDEYDSVLPLEIAPDDPTMVEMCEETGDNDMSDAEVNGEEPSWGEEDTAKVKKPRLDDSNTSACPTSKDSQEVCKSKALTKTNVEGVFCVPQRGCSTEKMLVFRSIPPVVMAKLSLFRISSKQLDHARHLFRCYEGTKAFHNFTPGGKSSDPSTMRFIVSVEVDDPIVLQLPTGAPASLRYPQGLEVVCIRFHGASFMLNQIRKMIGCVLSTMAGGIDDAWIRHCLSKSVAVGIPMAPANGLFLTKLDFRRYNARLDRIQAEGNNGNGKGAIDVDEVDPQKTDQMRRQILECITRREATEDITGRWMRSMRHVLKLAYGTSLSIFTPGAVR